MRHLISFLMLLILGSPAWATPTWESLAPGLGYQHIKLHPGPPGALIHLFKIDLKRYQLQLIQSKHAKPIRQLVKENNSLLGINGGFFTQELKPLGLRINNGLIHNPLRQVSWWGVFSVENNRPNITPTRNFKLKRSTQFAIQAGPRLIINGYIPKLKPGRAERSALAITRQGEVIIAATESASMTTTEFAQHLKKQNCHQALNLDGGSSTQIYGSINDFKLDRPSFVNIPDGIIIKKR